MKISICAIVLLLSKLFTPAVSANDSDLFATASALRSVAFTQDAVITGGAVSVDLSIPHPDDGGTFHIRAVAVGCGCTKVLCREPKLTQEKPVEVQVLIEAREPTSRGYSFSLLLERDGNHFVLPVSLSLTARFPFEATPKVVSIDGANGSRSSKSILLTQNSGPKWTRVTASSHYLEFETMESTDLVPELKSNDSIVGLWKLVPSVRDGVNYWEISSIIPVTIVAEEADGNVQTFSLAMGFSVEQRFSTESRLVRIRKGESRVEIAFRSKENMLPSNWSVSDMKLERSDGTLVVAEFEELAEKRYVVKFEDKTLITSENSLHYYILKINDDPWIGQRLQLLVL